MTQLEMEDIQNFFCKSPNRIKTNVNNLRTCEDCKATYCINGDESGFWSIFPYGAKKEGQCEFCRPTGRYSLKLK